MIFSFFGKKFYCAKTVSYTHLDVYKRQSEGSTVVLLSDVTEDVTFDKNITIDGGSKYTIFGVSTVKAGILTNLTLKPSEDKADGKLLTPVSYTHLEGAKDVLEG